MVEQLIDNRLLLRSLIYVHTILRGFQRLVQDLGTGSDNSGTYVHVFFSRGGLNEGFILSLYHRSYTKPTSLSRTGLLKCTVEEELKQAFH
jgi:hypothetical protein